MRKHGWTPERTPPLFSDGLGVCGWGLFWDKATLDRTHSESGKMIYHVRANFRSNHWWSWISLHHNLDFVTAGRVVESLEKISSREMTRGAHNCAVPTDAQHQHSTLDALPLVRHHSIGPWWGLLRPPPWRSWFCYLANFITSNLPSFQHDLSEMVGQGT